MKKPVLLLAAACCLAATANASDILVEISASSTVIDPANAVQQNIFLDQTTSLLTPTFYTASASNGGGFTPGSGTSNDWATVSLGHLHAYSYSDFTQNGTVSYSEGFVDLFANSIGTTPGTKGAPVVLTPSFNLTGVTSALSAQGGYIVEATASYSLIDVDNGDRNTNTVTLNYDLLNPSLNVFTGTLNVLGGDRVETEVVFKILTYQAGNSSVFGSLVDMHDTLDYYVDTNLPGQDFIDITGYDFASPAATGAPEPGTSALMGLGTLLCAGGYFRRRRSR
jgi:PEP-CTERM motif